MADPTTLREALLAEALGEAAKLMHQIQDVAPRVDEACRALAHADRGLSDRLESFEGRMAAITEHAKTRTFHHLAARTEEATRQTIEKQTRAMADAARLAFGAEIGSGLQRLQAVLQPVVAQAEHGWDRWLTHVAVAAASSAITWAVMVTIMER